MTKDVSIICLDGEVIDAILTNPWHKVSENLPKEDGVYLVKYSIGNYPITYPIVILYESGEWRNSHRLGDGAVTITHWMEIPELSEED